MGAQAPTATVPAPAQAAGGQDDGWDFATATRALVEERAATPVPTSNRFAVLAPATGLDDQDGGAVLGPWSWGPTRQAI